MGQGRGLRVEGCEGVELGFGEEEEVEEGAGEGGRCVVACRVHYGGDAEAHLRDFVGEAWVAEFDAALEASLEAALGERLGRVLAVEFADAICFVEPGGFAWWNCLFFWFPHIFF